MDTHSAPRVTARFRLARRLDRSASLPSSDHLRELMRRYRTERLPEADREEFEQRIRSFLRLEDHEMEGFAGPARQRDLSVRFHWGHDHDFGTFFVPGLMGERHVGLLATFIDRLGALPRDLTGTRVLDVGCWTGGTSLLLAAMGAEVVAIEEVRKYVECLRYMKESFGVTELTPRSMSLYECIEPGLQDSFDFVLFAGVLYHVTDPVLALRIVFDCLKDGGTCLVETAAARLPGRTLRYLGPERTRGGDVGGRSRSGWNWFVPSRSALARMMRDVGFVEVRVTRAAGGRAFAVGRRERHVDMLRAGLSSRRVR